MDNSDLIAYMRKVLDDKASLNYELIQTRDQLAKAEATLISRYGENYVEVAEEKRARLEGFISGHQHN